MPTITTKDGVEIFYKDWGRVSRSCSATAGRCRPTTGTTRCCSFCAMAIASSPMTGAVTAARPRPATGTTWITTPTISRRVTAHLDLKKAVHVGHSTGGGEVARYIGRHGESRVAKAALISAVPPLMVKTAANPGGLPKEVFDGFQAQLAANRSQFYLDLPAGPFYGFNRPGAKPPRRSSRIGGVRA